MKTNKIKCFFLGILFSAGVNANPAIYINALDLAAHGIKNNGLSLHGAVEIPINNNFSVGIKGGHTKKSEHNKKDFSSAGIYLDYNFLEYYIYGLKKDCWFIRNYIGLSRTYDNNAIENSDNKHALSSVGTFSGGNSKGGGGHGKSYNATANATAVFPFNRDSNVYNSSTVITNLISNYRPEIGLYVGKKYVFDNKLSTQVGVGISTKLKPTNGTHFQIGASDFILDTFINIGYKP